MRVFSLGILPGQESRASQALFSSEPESTQDTSDNLVSAPAKDEVLPMRGGVHNCFSESLNPSKERENGTERLKSGTSEYNVLQAHTSVLVRRVCDRTDPEGGGRQAQLDTVCKR